MLRLPHILTINLNPEQFTCPRCGADFEHIVRTGVQRNKSGLVQRYKCKVCGYRFNDREGFEKLKNNPTLILIAIDLYLKGLSTREIAHHLSMIYSSEISHVTVYRWIIKYLDILRKTRYLLASHISYRRDAKTTEKVLRSILNNVEIDPNVLLTDKLASYKKAVKELKENNNSSLKHISGKKFTDNVNNNVIERLNKTIKKRVRNAEKFDKKRNARIIVEGFKAYYNLIRPHLTLNNRAPAEKAKIKFDSNNRLIELIRKGNLRRID